MLLAATVNASPLRPKRRVMASTIDDRMPSGRNAATTMTSGKNETNAFPASATLRSRNSISSMRSHTFQASVRSNRVRREVMSYVLKDRMGFGGAPETHSGRRSCRRVIATR